MAQTMTQALMRLDTTCRLHTNNMGQHVLHVAQYVTTMLSASNKQRIVTLTHYEHNCSNFVWYMQ